MGETRWPVYNKSTSPRLMQRKLVWVFKSSPLFPEFMEIPTMAVAYFDHPTDYDTHRVCVKDLAEAGITCPHYTDYLDTIVRF